MQRVIPVFNTKDPTMLPESFNDVEFILDMEGSKANTVKAIIPFYYQLVVIDASDYHVLIADPQSRDILKINYKLPDLSSIEFRINNFGLGNGDFVELLKKIRNDFKRQLNTNNWFIKGFILEKIVREPKLLNTLEELLNKSRLEELKGIVIGDNNPEDLIIRNKSVLRNYLSSISQIQLKLDTILEKLYEMKCSWENLIGIKYGEKFNEISKGYSRINDIVDQRIRDLYRELDLETRKSHEKYRVMIDNIRHKITLIDSEIEKLRKRAACSDSSKKNEYLGLIRELRRKKSSLRKEIYRLEKESEEKSRLIKQQYSRLIRVEYMRKQFYDKERSRIQKDFETIVRKADYLLEDIHKMIIKINNLLEKYRDSLAKLYIRAPGFTQQVFYLKGYIVLGTKSTKIVTTSYIRNFDKPTIHILKPIYRYLVKNKALYKIKNNHDIVLKFNILNNSINNKVFINIK